MAHISKKQYEYRKEAAAKRSATNEEIAVKHGMTEHQAQLISRLCSLRHELHTNMGQVTINDSNIQIKPQLVDLAREIDEAELPQVPCIPIADGDYIDIDDIDELFESVKWPTYGTQEWQDKYDAEYTRIYGELEQLNKEIEEYLAEIDKEFGTSWCPTGSLRVF